MTGKAETALDLDELFTSPFTEGPWLENIKCVHPDMGGNHQLHISVRIPCASVGKRTSHCMIGGGRKNETFEQVANAKLIAAAPSLLELAIKQRDEITRLKAEIAEKDERIETLMHTVGLNIKERARIQKQKS